MGKGRPCGKQIKWLLAVTKLGCQITYDCLNLIELKLSSVKSELDSEKFTVLNIYPTSQMHTPTNTYAYIYTYMHTQYSILYFKSD